MQTPPSLAMRIPAKANERKASIVYAAYLTASSTPPRLHENVMLLEEVVQLLRVVTYAA